MMKRIDFSYANVEDKRNVVSFIKVLFAKSSLFSSSPVLGILKTLFLLILRKMENERFFSLFQCTFGNNAHLATA